MSTVTPAPGRPAVEAPIVVTEPGSDDPVFHVQAIPSLPAGVRDLVKENSGSFDSKRKAWWVPVPNRDRFLAQLARDGWPYRVDTLTDQHSTRGALEECATCAVPYKRGTKPERCAACGDPLRLVPPPT